MPIQLSTNTLKTRESTSDPWEASAVIVQSDLDSVLEITGDGVLDPSFTATDLTGAANELNDALTNLDADGVEYDSTESYSSGTIGAELTSQRNTLNQFDQNMAYVESGNTASRTYDNGNFISWKGTLYKANQAIPATTAFSTGSGGNLDLVAGNNASGGGFNSLLNTVNSSNSVAAPTVSDLNAIAGSNNKIYMCSWNGDTLHTPNKQGLTSAGYGYVISMVMGPKNYGVQMAFAVGDRNIYVRILTGSAWDNWIVVT